MSLLEESAELHQRVRAFARAALGAAAPRARAGFEPLALDIARFQARWSPGYARLVAASGDRLDHAATLPAVPAEAFRITRVALHDAALDAARFETSGTTAATRGQHALRDVETYRELSLLYGARALTSDAPGRRTVVALAPPPTAPPTSSLGFMMLAFMEAFDDRALADRWLLSDAGVDVAGLERAASRALQAGEPLLVLATSFALAFLLEALGHRRIACPKSTVVMQTGGFKGRTREIAPAELRARVAAAFGIAEARVIGEYGMTELSSQLYEGTLPGGALAGPPGVYLPPPWLRVDAVDPATLSPVAPGDTGIARFIDLANVDSAVAVVTQDRVRNVSGGIELLGRLSGAPARGCSLAIESLVAG